MELSYINIMLYATGIMTACVGLIFFAPALLLEKMFQVKITGEAALFITRHWALLVSLFGLLIICSVHNPEIRFVILIAAVIEKSVLILMILKNFNREFAKGLRGIIATDGICVILYLLYLTGIT